VIYDLLERAGSLLQYGSPICTRIPNTNPHPNVNPKHTLTLSSDAVHTRSSHKHVPNASLDKIEHFALIVAIF